MTPHDTVREFLASRGCPEDVVAGGLAGLVDNWERTVEQVESGYPLGLDDYLNDLDARQLLEEALEAASELERVASIARVKRADTRMRLAVRWVDECLWGARVAEQEGWSAERNWWYFALPIIPGPMLADDLSEPE